MMRPYWCTVVILVLVSYSSSSRGDTKSGRKFEKRKIEESTAQEQSTHLEWKNVHPTMSMRPAENKKYTRNSSFRRYIESGQHYVDKTSFIADVLNYQGMHDAIGISRPRQFGKTLNLDMLADFCSIDTDSTDLFHGSWTIMSENHVALRNKFMGKYPVIFLSLANVGNATSMNEAEQYFHATIRELYAQFEYLEDSEKVDEYYKDNYKRITQSDKYGDYDLFSVAYLCEMLEDHYGKNPILIMDNVDAPLAAAAVGGFPKSMITFLSRFMKKSLKVDTMYNKAIIAGVTPLQEYLPKNVDIFTIFNSQFGSSFGFTRAEVNELLVSSGKGYLMPNVTDWYSGFRIGGEDIYNPHSIISCRKNSWALERYATSSASLQTLTVKLLKNYGLLPSLNFQLLEANEIVEKHVPRIFFWRYLFDSENELLSYFQHVGIITTETKLVGEGGKPVLRLPNREIRTMLEKEVIAEVAGLPKYSDFVEAVENGDFDVVCRTLRQYLTKAGVYLTGTEDWKQNQRARLKDYIEVIIRKWTPDNKDEKKPHIVEGSDYVLIKFSCKRTKKPKLWIIHIEKATKSAKHGAVPTENTDVPSDLAKNAKLGEQNAERTIVGKEHGYKWKRVAKLGEYVVTLVFTDIGEDKAALAALLMKLFS